MNLWTAFRAPAVRRIVGDPTIMSSLRTTKLWARIRWTVNNGLVSVIQAVVSFSALTEFIDFPSVRAGRIAGGSIARVSSSKLSGGSSETREEESSKREKRVEEHFYVILNSEMDGFYTFTNKGLPGSRALFDETGGFQHQ